MAFTRRTLPHLWSIGRPIFVTWRLAGSLPAGYHFSRDHTQGRAFALMDRLLDECRAGPTYLRRPEIADMVVEAIHYGANVLNHYELSAFVVMPNHVHILITPRVDLPVVMKSLKSITAKRGNLILGLTGRPFWQPESYDRLVRDSEEFNRIQRYIENNPVKAGLALSPETYPWSSAFERGTFSKAAGAL